MNRGGELQVSDEYFSAVHHIIKSTDSPRGERCDK